MIRTKGEAGTGNVVEAVRHMRKVVSEIKSLVVIARSPSAALRAGSATKQSTLRLAKAAKEMRVPLELVKWVATHGKLPVVNFAAGGIATPADAALMMQLGSEGVFVGSGIFKSEDPAARAKAIVQATLHFDNPDIVAKVSEGLGTPMASQEIAKLTELYAKRGI
jgi:pyridoxal 5'-phosphate synthase pdxS subunit